MKFKLLPREQALSFEQPPGIEDVIIKFGSPRCYPSHRVSSRLGRDLLIAPGTLTSILVAWVREYSRISQWRQSYAVKPGLPDYHNGPATRPNPRWTC